VGALATLPMGVAADRWSRTRLLVISIVVWGIAEAVAGLSVSFVMLLLTRLALGAIVATAGPTVGSLTGDLFPAGERGRIYGYIITGELLGAGAGLLISGDIGAALGWRAGFIVLAAPSLALAWGIHRFFPEPARGGQSHLHRGDKEIPAVDEVSRHPERYPAPAEDEGTAGEESAALEQVERMGVQPEPEIVIHGDPDRITIWEAVRWVLKVRTNVLLILSSSLGYFFFAGLRTFALLFARSRYGVTQSVATLLVLVVGIAAIAGLLIAGRSADGLLRRGRLSARLDVGATGYLVAAGLFVPALLTTRLWIALPLIVVATTMLAGPNSPVDAARLDVVPSRMWGRTEAIRTFLRTLLEAFAPLLFGLVSEEFGSPSNGGFGSGVNINGAHASHATGHGLAFAFLVMLAPLAASGICLLFGRRSYPTDVASAAESEREIREEEAAAG
jgi:MFS family permease